MVKNFCSSTNQTCNSSTVLNETLTLPKYTICCKRYDDEWSIVEYLYNQGKCAEVYPDGPPGGGPQGGGKQQSRGQQGGNQEQQVQGSDSGAKDTSKETESSVTESDKQTTKRNDQQSSGQQGGNQEQQDQGSVSGAKDTSKDTESSVTERNTQTTRRNVATNGNSDTSSDGTNGSQEASRPNQGNHRL